MRGMSRLIGAHGAGEWEVALHPNAMHDSKGMLNYYYHTAAAFQARFWTPRHLRDFCMTVLHTVTRGKKEELAYASS